MINVFCGKCGNCKKLMERKQILKEHTESMDLENLARAKQTALALINQDNNKFLGTKILIVEEKIEVPEYKNNRIERPNKIIDKKYKFYDLTEVNRKEICELKRQDLSEIDEQRWKMIKLFVVEA